jgi:hypothetical protein
MEINAAIPVMISVPTMACRAPGVCFTSSVSGSKVDAPVCVMNDQLSSPAPWMITVESVDTSGMSASRKATVTRPRTSRSVAFRRFSTTRERMPRATR